MGTLVEFRGWLRLDLADPAGTGQRFGDADLDRAVGRAVAELSQAFPKRTDAEAALTGSGSGTAARTLALPAGTFAGLLDVEEVECPYGAGGAAATYPATLPAFRVAPDRQSVLLLTEDTPAAGAVVRVRWTAVQVISVGATSVPAELDYVLARGAAGFAMLAYSTPAADNFKYEDGATVAGVDDSMIPRAWRERANEALAEFRKALDRLEWRRAAGGGVVVWGSE